MKYSSLQNEVLRKGQAAMNRILSQEALKLAPLTKELARLRKPFQGRRNKEQVPGRIAEIETTLAQSSLASLLSPFEPYREIANNLIFGVGMGDACVRAMEQSSSATPPESGIEVRDAGVKYMQMLLERYPHLKDDLASLKPEARELFGVGMAMTLRDAPTLNSLIHPGERGAGR